MLEVQSVDVFYGDAQALHSVSMEMGANEIVAVLGSNGAGKTTLVKAISGIHPLRRGTVLVDGVSLTDLRPHQISSTGVAVVPEGRRLFTRMTVRENLEIGAYARAARRDLQRSLEQVYDLFPLLFERSEQKAGTLSGGQQQMLAIGRGLMAQPRYLLLDEPSLGLAPIIVDTMFDMITRVHSSGIGVLIVEQNVARALDICQRGYVLEDGRAVLDGDAQELLVSERVRRAYLAI